MFCHDCFNPGRYILPPLLSSTEMSPGNISRCNLRRSLR
jgi:hypothetical protein